MKYIAPIKQIAAALTCGLLTLTLVGCQQNGTTEPAASPSTTDPTSTASSTVSTAPSSIQIQLNRTEGQITDDSGQVLVEYAYDRPTVTIADNLPAQSAIQSDLEYMIQTRVLDFAKQELFPTAQSAYEDGYTLPLSIQLNMTIQRTDDTVISILTDELINAGSYDTDYRSAKNYRTETGEILTFSMLGDQFRDTASDLVAQQAARYADQLFDDYRDSLNRVVLDGTEDGSTLYEVNMPVYPTFYLTNDNIVFIAREQILQSAAAGILEFPIPYADFGDALDSSYLPNGSVSEASSNVKPAPAVEPESTTPEFQPRDYLTTSDKVVGNGWTLTLPQEWVNKVYVKMDQDTVAFFENGCYSEMDGGWLFSLRTYTDESYVDLPDYSLLSIDGDVSYVAIYPTDVQFEGASAENAQRYSAFSSQVESVLRTFTLTN